MRTLIASGMLGLLVLPATAAAQKLPDLKAMRVSLANDDTTPGAMMDNVGSSNADADMLRVAGDAELSLAEQSAKPETGTQAPVPAAKLVVYRPMSEVCDAVKQSAKSNNLPVSFFIRLLHQESGFRPDVVSHAGAQGVAQFMPETASHMGLENPFDPLQAIPASARLLRELLAQFGNIGLAAAAYNAGPRRVHDWLVSKDKKAKLPDETQGYVRTITGKPVENWKSVARLVPDKRPASHAPCKTDDAEVLQVADAQPETTRGKLAHLAGNLKGALKKIPELKARMASRERPSLTILKKDNARIALADHARNSPAKSNAMLARRAAKGRVRLARAS